MGRKRLLWKKMELLEEDMSKIFARIQVHPLQATSLKMHRTIQDKTMNLSQVVIAVKVKRMGIGIRTLFEECKELVDFALLLALAQRWQRCKSKICDDDVQREQVICMFCIPSCTVETLFRREQ
jgi:hypothetical protein